MISNIILKVTTKDKNLSKQFSFKSFSRLEVEKTILSLDNINVSKDSDIPTKIVQLNDDVLSKFLFHEFKRSNWFQTREY